MAELNARDRKLVQYLNEAFGKEKQLETALEAHIGMTTRAPYKKRLQQHLQETKRHARDVERRIRQLGGNAETVPVPGPEVIAEAASRVQEVAQKGAALVQGPLHAVRGIGEQERQLKNARTEFSNEAEEIAHYKAIETVADNVGDRDTAQLARAIRREEERMASFLDRLIPQLARAVVQDEIPAPLRNGGARRRSATTRRSTSARRRTGSASGAGGSRRTTSRARSGGTSRARASGGSSTRARRSSGSSARKTSARSASSARSGGSSSRRTTSARSSGRASSGRGSSRRGASRTTSRASGARRTGTARTSGRRSTSAGRGRAKVSA